MQTLSRDGFLPRNSAMTILNELISSSTGLFKMFTSLRLGNWKMRKTTSNDSNALCLKFSTYSSGSSGRGSSSILLILFFLRCSFLRDGSDSHPVRAVNMFYAMYSSSSLGIDLKGAKVLNLLSTASMTLSFSWPVHPSLTFSSLFPLILRYSSLGHLKAGNS